MSSKKIVMKEPEFLYGTILGETLEVRHAITKALKKLYGDYTSKPIPKARWIGDEMGYYGLAFTSQADLDSFKECYRVVIA